MSSRANRPSPSESATVFPVGYSKLGNDGNTWTITEDGRGVKRWKKTSSGAAAANVITTSNSAKATPVVAAAGNTPVEIKPSLFVKFADKRAGSYFFPPIVIYLQGIKYEINWELNIPPNRIEAELGTLPFDAGNLQQIKLSVFNSQSYWDKSKRPDVAHGGMLFLYLNRGKNLTLVRYEETKAEIIKEVRRKYAGGHSTLPALKAPDIDATISTAHSAGAATVELPPLVVIWRGYRFEIPATYTFKDEKLTLDFTPLAIDNSKGKYDSLQRSIRLFSSVSMRTQITPSPEFNILLSSRINNQLYTAILDRIQSKLDDNNFELDMANARGVFIGTNTAPAQTTPPAAPQGAVPVDAPPYAFANDIPPATIYSLGLVSSKYKFPVYINYSYRREGKGYLEFLDVDMSNIIPQKRGECADYLEKELDFIVSKNTQNAKSDYFSFRLFVQLRFELSMMPEIRETIDRWLDKNPDALLGQNATATPVVPDDAPPFAKSLNLQPNELFQIMPPIYVDPKTASLPTKDFVRKYREAPQEGDIIINVAYKYTKKNDSGGDLSNYMGCLVFDFSPFNKDLREEVSSRIYQENWVSSASLTRSTGTTYNAYLLSGATSRDMIDIRLAIVVEDIYRAIRGLGDVEWLDDRLPNFNANYVYHENSVAVVSADTPAAGAAVDELANFKRELEQLYIMRGFLSPIAFEKRLEINQRIFEVQNSINEANFNLMEQQDANADIIEDLFEQSFTPIEHEYNNVYSQLGEANADTALFFAPDGTPSQLSDELNEVVRTPYFIEWFGNWQLAYTYKDVDPEAIPCSTIMTEHYEPLVVWHGTGEEFSYFNFTQFPAAYFARNQKYSEWFAETRGGSDGYTLPFFLNMRNPLDLTNFHTREVTSKEFFDYLFLKTGLLPTDLNVNRMFLDPNLPPLQAWVYLRRNPAMLKRLSESHVFDGIHYYETNPQVPQNDAAFVTEAYIIFKPEQCKLAEPRRGKIMMASLKSFLLKRGGRV